MSETVAETVAQDNTETAVQTPVETTTEQSVNETAVRETATQEPVKPVEETKSEINYTDFAIPEGVTLDAELMTAFKDLAKEFGLTQENAQKLVDLQANAIKAQEIKIKEQLDQVTESWKKEVYAMDDFKGDVGEKNISNAAAAVKKLGGDKLIEYLETTGLGDHPSMVKLGYEIHKLISEDVSVGGQGPTINPKTLKDALYGG